MAAKVDHPGCAISAALIVPCTIRSCAATARTRTGILSEGFRDTGIAATEESCTCQGCCREALRDGVAQHADTIQTRYTQDFHSSPSAYWSECGCDSRQCSQEPDAQGAYHTRRSQDAGRWHACEDTYVREDDAREDASVSGQVIARRRHASQDSFRCGRTFRADGSVARSRARGGRTQGSSREADGAQPGSGRSPEQADRRVFAPRGCCVASANEGSGAVSRNRHPREGRTHTWARRPDQRTCCGSKRTSCTHARRGAEEGRCCHDRRPGNSRRGRGGSLGSGGDSG